MNAPVRTLIVGAGPAGTAVLSAADKSGCLPDLVRAGLIMVEREDTIGSGLLGRYTINSDSTAETFLTAISQSQIDAVRALESHSAVAAIAAHIGDLGVPLPKAGVFLELLGRHLIDFVSQEGGTLLCGHEVLFVQQMTGGLWRAHVRNRANNSESDIIVQSIVLATGGHQPAELIENQTVAGVAINERYGEKLVASDVFLAEGGLPLVRERLLKIEAPRIAVIGGSTSAVAALNKLLRVDAGIDLAPGALTLLHRRPLRPFYHSIEAAHAEGYTDFGPEDICPVSGFVYRLGGFRLEARALVIRTLRIGGATPDPRLRLHQITGDIDAEAIAVLDAADVVIPALGYRPRAIALRDYHGKPLAIAAELAHQPPMVDGACRIIGADGAPIPGLYGIGLAAGFVPHGPLGGEPSFRGQANGLWLWQNGVGQLIVDQLLAGDQQARAVA